MDSQLLISSLSKIKWESYSHPCTGRSILKNIPTTIIQLYDDDIEASNEAASRLWNDVAHQGNVGSISVPIFPFLINRINSQPSLIVLRELVEIIYHFSFRLAPPDMSKWTPKDKELCQDDFEWTFQLRELMCESFELFVQLCNHSDEEVSLDSETIVENIKPHLLNPY